MIRFLLVNVVLTFVVLCMCAAESFAGVTVVQQMSFGSFVVKRNDAQYDITVSAGGSYGYSSVGYILIVPPQQGIFDIDGLPASTPVSSVTVSQYGPLAGSGDSFEMLSFQTSNNPTTDSSGVLRVSVGGTARSSGTGNPISDQTYNGQLEITINF